MKSKNDRHTTDVSRRSIFIILASILMTLSLGLTSVFAEVASSAEAYCTATVGSTGTTVWQNCVENKRSELEECDQDPQPASRTACKENALTYGESDDSTEDEVPTELLTPFDLSAENTHDCNGVQISIEIDCVDADNPILSYLGGFINFLAGGVFIVVIIMIAVAGVEYTTARGSPQKVEDAKRRITNALVALVTFIFMYAILQWLIPGGIF